MFNGSDKVVCVDVSGFSPNYEHPDGMVEAGKIYVVSRYGPNEAGVPVVQIVGKRCLYMGFYEDGWKPRRFRKLSEIQEENRLKRENKEVAESRDDYLKQIESINQRIQDL